MPFPHCWKGLWVAVSVASASFTLDTVKENLKIYNLVHLPKPGVTWKALDILPIISIYCVVKRMTSLSLYW